MTSEALPDDGRHFFWYLAALGAASFALGLQFVIYPWLVVGVLNEAPDRVGVAQMMVLLPTLFLILVGGALSDQRHAGNWVSRLYLGYLAPLAVLLVALWQDWLSFPLLLMVGVGFGVMNALVQPARESLLSQIAGKNVQSFVARAAVVQFLCQSIGVMLAGQMERVSWEALVALQLGMFVLAAVLVRRSGTMLPAAPQQRQPLSVTQVTDGLRLVWHERKLLHLMMIVSATGFLSIGVYLVALPLLARDVYGESAAFYATLQVLFTGGIIGTNVIMARMSPLRRPGRALVGSLAVRGVLVALVGLQLPIWGLYVAVVLWGVLSGVSMTLGRTIVHEGAPLETRARVLSVYQLALFGAAPLGAWLCGLLIAWQGVLPSMVLVGAGTVAVACWAWLASELWRLRIADRC